jgi:hypothetical protein
MGNTPTMGFQDICTFVGSAAQLQARQRWRCRSRTRAGCDLVIVQGKLLLLATGKHLPKPSKVPRRRDMIVNLEAAWGRSRVSLKIS